jgi:FKBP-type peptidyl-prolyl cis-trans isomerase FklB
MKKIILTVLCLSAAAPTFAADTNQLDETSRVSYAVGVMLGKQWQQQELGFLPDVVLRGIKDAQSGGTTLLTDTQVQETLANFRKDFSAKQQKLNAERGVKNKAEGEKYLADNLKKDGVKTIEATTIEDKPSQVQYLVLSNGTGPVPTAADTVTVNYKGSLLDGTEFDSSYKRGQPASFPVMGVIRGWTAALQKMHVGSKWKLFIPADLAYGEQGRPGIPPNSTLIFEVELLETKSPTPAPPATPVAPLTSEIIKVPSKAEMDKGAKIEYIKPEDAKKIANQSK